MNDQANSVDERYATTPATLTSWSRQDTTWMLGLFGTAIGAGTLFLPINAGLGGFWPLVILALLSCVWMVRDARAGGRSAWPYVLVTLALGSFGILFYLLARIIGETQTRAS